MRAASRQNALRSLLLSQHALLLKTDGTVWVAGQNSDGELGLGHTNNQTSLVQLAAEFVARHGNHGTPAGTESPAGTIEEKS